MIKITDLKKNFGEIEVLKGVNLNIEAGEIFGIIGRSGAGKSTIMRCINGLEKYTSGSVIVDGQEVKELSGKKLREFRKEVGMIFQQFSLLERLTVYENIALQMKMWKASKNEINQRVLELLELVDLTDKVNSYPSELSGGQKQRVAIARALSMNPKILLCDEATSALDPKTAQSIIELLTDINNKLGITIIVVTHQMEVIKKCCDRMTIIENGILAETGNVEDIFVSQSEPLQRLLGDSGIDFPKSGVNMKIILSKDNSDKPIVSMITKALGIDILVLGGESASFKEHTLGTIYINANESHEKEIEDYLNKHSIRWLKINA